MAGRTGGEYGSGCGLCIHGNSNRIYRKDGNRRFCADPDGWASELPAFVSGMPGPLLSAVSLEEAYRYREEIWNPEGKGSSYSRGFWLRTPAYETDEYGNFVYGNREYVVDLENGCPTTGGCVG